jgi:chromodomain-helicase-DNA-binding protein 1
MKHTDLCRKGEEGPEYFVKWNELTHDECTWEAEADISAFKPQIERFHLIQSRRKKKFSGKTKSIIRDMQAFEGSPKFLASGTLLLVAIYLYYIAWFYQVIK